MYIYVYIYLFRCLLILLTCMHACMHAGMYTQTCKACARSEKPQRVAQRFAWSRLGTAPCLGGGWVDGVSPILKIARASGAYIAMILFLGPSVLLESAPTVAIESQSA